LLFYVVSEASCDVYKTIQMALILLLTVATFTQAQNPKPNPTTGVDILLREPGSGPAFGGSGVLSGPGVLDIDIRGAGIALPPGLPDPSNSPATVVDTPSRLPAPASTGEQEKQSDKAGGR